MYDSSQLSKLSLHHLVVWLQQYLTKHIVGLIKVHFQPISFHRSSHLFGYSFHIWNHNCVLLLMFIQVRGLISRGFCESTWACLIQCQVWQMLCLSHPPLADPVELCLPPPATNSGNHSSIALTWCEPSPLLYPWGHSQQPQLGATGCIPTLDSAPEGGCYCKWGY